MPRLARAATPPPPRRMADLRDVLALRAEVRARLYGAGEYDLHEAVDVLQHFAEDSGLTERIGQDAVQLVIAAAFAPYREAHDHE